jgi:hypothetical protein
VGTRGRRKRTLEDVVDVWKALGSEMDEQIQRSPPDHSLFVWKRFGELAAELRRDAGPGADDDLLCERAVRLAVDELAARLKTGRSLFWKRSGPKPKQDTEKVTESDTALRREYALVRAKLSGSGPQYRSVAEHLWNKKYKNEGTFPSSQALRMRITRAMKKVEH